MKSDIVEIPEGEIRLAPMRWITGNGLPDTGIVESESDGFSLNDYDSIETLIIPESIDIPHSDDLSPFACHQQYYFVYNGFTECRKLHINRIVNHSPYLSVVDGALYSSDMSRLIFCFEEKTSFVVPRSVTTIEPFAFCQQKGLESISLHDNITSIGDSSFMNCDSLREIVLPERLASLPWSCFDGCSSLRNVEFPQGLEVIYKSAFRNCRALTNVRLPSSLKALDSFEGCSSLREIDIPASVECVGGFMFCPELRHVTLHEGIKRINDYAFRYCDKLRSINFPEGLEYIGARAFYPSSLHRAVFPDSLREIGDEAFYYNSKLCSLTFTSGETEIGASAFACCPRLFRMFIRKPKGMKISDKAFDQDKSLDRLGFWD